MRDVERRRGQLRRAIDDGAAVIFALEAVSHLRRCEGGQPARTAVSRRSGVCSPDDQVSARRAAVDRSVSKATRAPDPHGLASWQHSTGICRQPICGAHHRSPPAGLGRTYTYSEEQIRLTPTPLPKTSLESIICHPLCVSCPLCRPRCPPFAYPPLRCSPVPPEQLIVPSPPALILPIRLIAGRPTTMRSCRRTPFARSSTGRRSSRGA